MIASSNIKRLIFDSGCDTHMHNNDSGLHDITPYQGPQVRGVSGEASNLIHSKGEHPILGTVCIGSINQNLYSIPTELDKGLSFFMTGTHLYIWDADGDLFHHATRSPGHLFTSSIQSLESPIKLPNELKTKFKLSNIFKIKDIMSTSQYITAHNVQTFIPPESIPRVPSHITAVERQRATDARSMHHRLIHPSDEVLGKALDAGCYPNCILTSRDLKNALLLYGPCSICIHGKMKAPHEPPSPIRKMEEVASIWYADIHALGQQSIGGNTQLLVLMSDNP
jgi:hypothetical protein